MAGTAQIVHSAAMPLLFADRKALIVRNLPGLTHKFERGDISSVGSAVLVLTLKEFGAPCKTRTCDLLVRSQTLYPTELRARALWCNDLRRGGFGLV